MGPASFARGLFEPLVEPVSIWSRVRPERPLRSLMLILCAAFCASGVLALCVLVGGPRTLGAAPVAALGWWVAGGLCFASLSLMEAAGMAIVGSRHGWRRSPGHVLAIVSHAAPAWMLGGLCAGIAWQLLQRVDAPWESPALRLGGQTVLPEGGAVWASMLLACGIGLVVFEWLAYKGLMSLRFASKERELGPAAPPG